MENNKREIKFLENFGYEIINYTHPQAPITIKDIKNKKFLISCIDENGVHQFLNGIIIKFCNNFICETTIKVNDKINISASFDYNDGEYTISTKDESIISIYAGATPESVTDGFANITVTNKKLDYFKSLEISQLGSAYEMTLRNPERTGRIPLKDFNPQTYIELFYVVFINLPLSEKDDIVKAFESIKLFIKEDIEAIFDLTCSRSERYIANYQRQINKLEAERTIFESMVEQRKNEKEKIERKELGLRLVKSLNQRMNYLSNQEK